MLFTPEIGMFIKNRHIVNYEAIAGYNQCNDKSRNPDFPETWEIMKFWRQLPVIRNHGDIEAIENYAGNSKH